MNEPYYLRRPNILPNNISASFLLAFLAIAIPATYWFELWVVLPYTFSNYPTLYWTCFIFGHFILHNVVGNLLALLLLDTSIRGRKMPSEGEPGAQYCPTCATYTPPRSYHCSVCNICILKRDHHCEFTNCCVGFYNHRYFVCFLFYVTLSLIIALPFNIYFIGNNVSFADVTFPYWYLFSSHTNLSYKDVDGVEIKHVYFLIGMLGSCMGVFTLLWLSHHLQLVFSGAIGYEMKRCVNMYNLGTKKNIELVFGRRWYLAVLSPYIKSPLIGNGVKFPVND